MLYLQIFCLFGSLRYIYAGYCNFTANFNFEAEANLENVTKSAARILMSSFED